MSSSEAMEILNQETLSRASELIVCDSKGGQVKFGFLFEDSKTVVVFIRHFFCGLCHAYVSQLAKVPQSALDSANTKIIVIGCGEGAAVPAFAESTKFSGAIYTDPLRKLYHALGMTKGSLALTPAGQTKRSYVTTSIFSTVVRAIWRGPVKHPNLIGKQGNISQLGGDFILGPGSSCSFASFMQHAEDHVEVGDLMAGAGIKYP